MINRVTKKLLPTTALLALAGLAVPQALAEEGSFQGAAKDAWLTGKIETVYALNEHLNPFTIDTHVEDGLVRLTGTVESDIDRELAGQLAKNVEGITDVENELVVDPEAAADVSADAGARRDFGTWVDDATTTAAVKGRLVANANTKGLKIDVDTHNDVVTLSGRVATGEEKALAEEVAHNVRDVTEVRNNLVVDPE